MANPSGNQQEQTHVSSSSFDGNPSNDGNSVPETSGSALALKHNPGISLDWTPAEQAILEEGVSKLASEASVMHYAKIALKLQNKTVRDVAMRVKWMTERVSDPATKSSHFAARSSVPAYSTSMISMDNDDGISCKAIGGPTGELLEQNEQVLNQISANLAAFQLQENINLFCQIRDNSLQIINELNEQQPEAMKQMPPLPVKLDEKLMDSVLPRKTQSTQS